MKNNDENVGASMNFGPGSIALAVDTKDVRRAITLINDVRDYVSIIKLGLEFFIANGPQGVNLVYKETGMPIFLDLKLFDIPNTVRGAIESILAMGSVCITTIHISGGGEMLSAAKNANKNQLLLAGVTVLTNIPEWQGTEAVGRRSTKGKVLHLARVVSEFGIRAFVCSAHEVPDIKRYHNSRSVYFPFELQHPAFKQFDGNVITIVPGIRSAGSDKQDQRRTATPGEAIKNGADILVIGREITDSKDPRSAAQRIATEVKMALDAST